MSVLLRQEQVDLGAGTHMIASGGEQLTLGAECHGA
jgi:hypothetical protein